VKNLSPDAEQFRQINGFMVQHRLTPQEVGDGFILMAMMKNGDPRALQKLDEYRTRIAAAMGETIPQDIQAKIESGEISDSVGKQMAKDRAQMRGMEQQQAQREADDFNAREYQRMEQLANAQAGAVSAWDAEQRKLDPDFAKKENAIARYARALMQEHGYPPTSDAAVILIKAAYDQVNADFTAALPAKEPHARPPIAPSSTGAKPVPRTLAEAVAQAAAM